MRKNKHTANTPGNEASTALPAVVTDVKNTYRKVMGFARRRCQRCPLTLRPKRGERFFLIWQKVRLGKIADVRTMAAIAQDAELQRAFNRFDQAGPGPKMKFQSRET